MSVKLFFWNVRGLNDPNKYRHISDWLKCHKPIFGAFLETHIKELSLAQLMTTICRDWHYLSNHNSDEDGRIVVVWKDPVKVSLLSQSRQMVTCEVQIPNKPPIYYSAIYASNIHYKKTCMFRLHNW